MVHEEEIMHVYEVRRVAGDGRKCPGCGIPMYKGVLAFRRERDDDGGCCGRCMAEKLGDHVATVMLPVGTDPSAVADPIARTP